MCCSRTNIVTLFLVGIIFALGIWVQTHIFLNGDTSWLLHAGNRLLQGGNYRQNFFEVNTPMAIFVYLPAVILSKVTQISFIYSLPVYIFFLIVLSWIICASLCSQVFKAVDAEITPYFLVIISFVFILLPASQFSQREHLLVVLTMPYLLLTIIRAKENKPSFWLVLIIGLLAGIGFGIKPYFLLLWIAFELYLIYQQRAIFACMRLEFFAVTMVLIGYVLAALYFTPEYVTHVLPIIWHFYYFIFSYSWVAVLTRPLAIFSVLVIIFYILLRRQIVNKQVADVFAIAIIPGLLIYILQRSIFYYHLLPAISFVSLLLFLLLSDVCKNVLLPVVCSFQNKMGTFVVLGCTMTAMLIVPIAVTYEQTIRAFTSEKRSDRGQLIKVFNQYAHGGPVYFFTDQIADIYPVVDYANVVSGSRFPGLWLVDSLYAFGQLALDAKQRILLLNTKKFLLNAVWEDLQHEEPKLILVQRHGPGWDYFHIKVDFINFFNQDPRFIAFWQKYIYVGKVGFYDVYKTNDSHRV